MNSRNNCEERVWITKGRIIIFLMSMFLVFGKSILQVQADENSIPGELYNAEIDCDCDMDEYCPSQDTPIIYSDMQPMTINTNTLPSQVNLSTSDYFPQIRSQHGGSCAAWASVYYQYTYEVAKHMSEKDDNQTGDDEWKPKTDDSKVFSPKSVWNYLNDGTNTGVFSEECYEVLSQVGALKWTQFPQTSTSFDWYYGADEVKTRAALLEALEVRVSDYKQNSFLASDSNTNAPVITNVNDNELLAMKASLAQGHPFVIYTYIGSYYVDTLSNGEKGCLYVNGRDGYHAMTVVGYDDTISYDLNGSGDIQDYEKGAFLVANSWGTSSNNDGFIWIMYDALNAVSNASNLSSLSNRVPAISGYIYRTIQVDEYDNDLTVEITVEQRERNALKVTLGKSNTLTSSKSTFTTCVNAAGGSLGFDGEEADEPLTRMFIFDYSDLYNGDDKIYWVDITNLSANSTNATLVKKIRWIKSNGTLMEELGPQRALTNTSRSFSSDSNYTDLRVNDVYSGYIRESKPEDWFTFTPPLTGNYVLYTKGSTDTIISVYNTSGECLISNDDYTRNSYNAAINYEFEGGTEYRVKVNTYDIQEDVCVGDYILYATRETYLERLEDSNPDARNLEINAEVSSVFTQMKLTIGQDIYTFARPANNSTVELSNAGYNFKVTFTPSRNGCSIIWEIHGKIPATNGSNGVTMNTEFESGSLHDEGTTYYNFLAYKSSIKTGIAEGTTVQALLNSMAQTGYSLEALNNDNSAINSLSTTKVATGMKIIKRKTSSGKIDEVYYVVLFGDVVGNGTVGDGVIASADSLAVLNYIVQNSELGSLAAIAADVNHDGQITSEDSNLITSHVIKVTTIDQDCSVSEVPDDCYYLEPITWL